MINDAAATFALFILAVLNWFAGLIFMLYTYVLNHAWDLGIFAVVIFIAWLLVLRIHRRDRLDDDEDV